MKVLYDYQIFDTQISGGISRYHADLYNGCKQNDVEPLLGIKYSDNIYLKDLGLNFGNTFTAEDRFLNGYNFKFKHPLYRALTKCRYSTKSSWEYNAEFCRNLLRTEKYDIFHPTYYDDLYSDVVFKAPIVLTIHDMTYENFPLFFHDVSVIKRKKALVERADAIIAISDFTKNEILKYYDNLDESKIYVVYHGIDLNDLNITNISYNKENYILYVGERSGYKDFFTLLRAMKILKSQNSNLRLLTIGRPFNSDELLYIEFLGLNDYVQNLGRVSDKELKDLYINAQMFVSTSMSEGFGLPLLECMKHGTPMVLSDIPVYNEVAGEAALYFKTNDEKSLADTISHLYGNCKVQKELMIKGRERVLMFDKKDMAKNTLDVYKNCYS